MKRHLLIILAALLPIAASAQTKVEIDGIWYNLVSKAKQANVTSSGGTEYSDSITIPATVTYEDVTYSVTSIGDSAFYHCSSLTAINIPEGVTSIEDFAFDGCSSLTAINIPKGMTSIGVRAFFDCSSLTAINIPEGVTSIQESTFEGCSSLNTITIPKEVKNIGYGAFQHCSGLTSINIPEGIKSIEWNAFSGCSSLTAITLPESVTDIGPFVFSGCNSLININIPDSITNITPGVFNNCSSLNTITIPEGVTHIEDWAFEGCSGLTSIICQAVTPPVIGYNTFNGVDKSIPVYVPTSSIETYKAAKDWREFSNIVAIVEGSLGRCTIPAIYYIDSKVVFTCATEGAIVKSSTTINGTGYREEMEFDLIPTYTITAYATKEHYENSDEVTLTLCWVPCTEEHKEGDTDGILTIPSQPVLIQCQGDVITLSGLAEGAKVAIYASTGTLVGNATAASGTASIATNLEAGTTAIVKIGDYSIKVAIK